VHQLYLQTTVTYDVWLDNLLYVIGNPRGMTDVAVPHATFPDVSACRVVHLCMINTHAHTYTHTHTYAHSRRHARAFAPHPHAPPHTHMHMHSQLNRHVHAHVHTDAQRDTDIHTHACACAQHARSAGAHTACARPLACSTHADMQRHVRDHAERGQSELGKDSVRTRLPKDGLSHDPEHWTGRHAVAASK
jgi:hypothetical protein